MAAKVTLTFQFPARVSNAEVRALVEQWLQQADELEARSDVHWTMSAARRSDAPDGEVPDVSPSFAGSAEMATA